MTNTNSDSTKSKPHASRNDGACVRGEDMSLHALNGFSQSISTELESDSPLERGSASGVQPRCP